MTDAQEEGARILLNTLQVLNQNVCALYQKLESIQSLTPAIESLSESIQRVKDKVKIEIGDISIEGNNFNQAMGAIKELAQLNTTKQENLIKKTWGGL